MSSNPFVQNNQKERPVPISRRKTLDDNKDECGSAHHQKPTPSKNVKNKKKQRSHRLSLSFAFFMGAIFVPFLLAYWYLFEDAFSAYIVSGIYGLCLTLFALRHFLSLLKFRRAMLKYEKMNIIFQAENLCLRHEVDKVTKAKNGLKAIHCTWTDLNEKQKQNLKTFRQIEQNMKVANFNNIKGIESVRDRVKRIIVRLEQMQKQRERDVLFKVFNRLENGQKDGLSRKDFEEFITMIPQYYKQRFERLGSFDKLANGNDSIDADDFKLCLDVFAEMKVDGVANEMFAMEFTKRRSTRLEKRRSKIVTNPFAMALLENASPSPQGEVEEKDSKEDDDEVALPLFYRQSVSEHSKSYY